MHVAMRMERYRAWYIRAEYCRGTVLLELLTQWLKPLRECSAPTFTPQSESAAPLLALLYCTVGGTGTGMVLTRRSEDQLG